MATEVQMGGSPKIEDVVSVARDGAQVGVADAAVAVIRGCAFVEQLVASNQSVYGLTTGFGKLATSNRAS